MKRITTAAVTLSALLTMLACLLWVTPASAFQYNCVYDSAAWPSPATIDYVRAPSGLWPNGTQIAAMERGAEAWNAYGSSGVRLVQTSANFSGTVLPNAPDGINSVTWYDGDFCDWYYAGSPPIGCSAPEPFHAEIYRDGSGTVIEEVDLMFFSETDAGVFGWNNNNRTQIALRAWGVFLGLERASFWFGDPMHSVMEDDIDDIMGFTNPTLDDQWCIRDLYGFTSDDVVSSVSYDDGLTWDVGALHSEFHTLRVVATPDVLFNDLDADPVTDRTAAFLNDSNEIRVVHGTSGSFSNNSILIGSNSAYRPSITLGQDPSTGQEMLVVAYSETF